jgi:hypothetical protein
MNELVSEDQLLLFPLAKQRVSVFDTAIWFANSLKFELSGRLKGLNTLSGQLNSAASRLSQRFHLIEQPIDGNCSFGPYPVSAICFMASNRSRRALAMGVIREASRRPRYCSSSRVLKQKKSGVHCAL